MDRMSLAKKRMVYPERLELDSWMKRTTTPMSPVGSWCETSSASDVASLSTPHPGLEVLTIDSCDEDDFPPLQGGEPVLLSCSSLNTWDQRSFGQNSPIKTIYQANGGYNSYFPHEDGESFIQRRIRHLVQLFRARTQKFRRRLELPPTPSTIRSEQGVLETAPPPRSEREELTVAKDEPLSRWMRFKNWRLPPFIVDPHGYWYVSWLTAVTVAFLYNACVIPLRSAFPYQTPDNALVWLLADYTADLFYLVDLVLVKPRLKFIDQGFWVDDRQLMWQNYWHKLQFKMDLLSLLPLDSLYYLNYGVSHIALRLPRLLKVQSFGELYGRLDSMLPSPYTVRVARTVIYMLYLIHCNACAFYAFSAWEGIASNGWVFNGVGNAYIRCFFFATKTGISIGKNPKPETTLELVFMTWNWLQGVFVFALLISQMRDIVASATGVQNEYRKIVDGTLEYTRRMNLPVDLQERVKLWFTFTWTQQRTLDERQITDHLPDKLKTDVAISVHIQTLNKVQLFKDCDEALLRELVLKLKPVIFLPGDAVITKGEVGKEMYIVKTGQVQVMGGPAGGEVLATLSEGSVFGEIALLALADGNRRTATVRSKGYSNVFVLSKDDLNEAIEHYPAAQKILNEKAQSLMKANLSRKLEQEVEDVDDDNVIFGGVATPAATPKLVHTVLQVVPAHSGAARLLKYGSRGRRGAALRRRARTGDSQANKEPVAAYSLPTPPVARLQNDWSDSDPSSCERKVSLSAHAGELALTSSDEEDAFECRVVVHHQDEYGK